MRDRVVANRDAIEAERFWDDAERMAVRETDDHRLRRRTLEAEVDVWMAQLR